MATAARLPLAAWRNELCVRTIKFVGIDLTAVDMRAQVRLRPDTPGAPLISLATVTTAAAEGLKLDGVATVGGVPTSTVLLRINKATMQDPAKVPYGGEAGADTTLAYAIQLGGVTRVVGQFLALASVMDSDGAQAGSVSGYGAAGNGQMPWNGAQLTFGDEAIQIAIDGADLLQPFMQKADAAAAAAAAAADTAKTIADSLGTVTVTRWGVDQSAGVAGGGANFTYIADGPMLDGTLDKIFARSTTAGPRTIQVLTRTGTTNSFTSVQDIAVTVAIGENTFDVSALKIASNGRYLAINGATYRDAPGHKGWYIDPKVGSSATATTSLSNYDIVLAADIKQVSPIGGASVLSLTQTAYDALDPPVATSLYAASSVGRRRLFLGSLLLSSVIYPLLTSVGDSTAAAYAGGDAVASFLVNAKSTVIAVPGHTIDQQLNVWNGQTGAAKLAADIVTIQVGLNDVPNAASSGAANTAAVAAIGRYQNLVDTIRGSTKAGCKIVVVKMLPCRQRWIDIFGATNGPFAQEAWSTINDAIAGSGPNPITSVDGRVTTHVPLLDSGSGKLAPAFDTGDHIHPNNAGRKIIAQAENVVLMAIGAIQ